MINSYKNLTERPELCSKATKKKVTFVVIIVHIFVIFLPVALIFVYSWIKSEPKKIETIKIKLVTPTIPRQRNEQKDPTLKPAPEQPVKKTEPVIKEPKIEPKIEPKVEPIKEPQVKATPKEPVVKPRETTKPTPKKVEQNKTPPKKEVKPVKNDDTSDLEVVRSMNEVVPKRPTTSQRNTAQNPNNNIKSRNPSSSDSAESATYDEELAGIIYQLWNPPNQQLLNGRKVQVTIRLKIDKYGRIIEKKIISQSGFRPMDVTAVELLRKITVIPIPPDKRTELEIILSPDAL